MNRPPDSEDKKARRMRVAIVALASVSMLSVLLAHTRGFAPAKSADSAFEKPESVLAFKDSGMARDETVPARETDPATASLLTREEGLRRSLAELQWALDSTNPAAREFALTNLLPALLREDPAAAGHWAETITDPELRESALRQVARLWAAQDSAGALAWAGSLAEPLARDTTLTDVCLQVARTDPAAAGRMRDQFVPDNVPSLALNDLAQQWAQQDFPGALAWTLARTQNDQRDGIIARLVFVESQTDPAAAAQLAVEQIPAGPAQDEAVMSVVHQWALRDPASVSAWVNQFPAGPLRDRAILELSGIAEYRNLASTP